MGVVGFADGETASRHVLARCGGIGLLSARGGKPGLGVTGGRRWGLGVAVLAFSVGLRGATSYGERRMRFRGGEMGAGLVETAFYNQLSLEMLQQEALTSSGPFSACLCIIGWQVSILNTWRCALLRMRCAFAKFGPIDLLIPQSSIAPVNGKPRQCLWLLDEPVKERMVLAVNPVVVENNLELRCLHKLKHMLIESLPGRYEGRRTPHWTWLLKPQRKGTDLRVAATSEGIESKLRQRNSRRTEGHSARHHVACIVLEDDVLIPVALVKRR